MAEWVRLAEANAKNVHDGDIVAMERLTHPIPFAAGHGIIRQKLRHLSHIRMMPDRKARTAAAHGVQGEAA